MIKTIKKKVFILTLSALSLVMMIMGIGLAQPIAKADVVAKSVSEITFEMVDAAQVRLDGKNGMRFAGKMSASDYEAINKYGYANIEYGVFIMPQSYLKKGALNKENTIDKKVFVYGSQYTEPTYDDNGVTKYRILHTETAATKQDSEYYAFGSVHNVLPQNLATAYTACAYIKATQTVGEVEYKFATAMQSPRSMLEVAFRAINSGDYDDTENDVIVEQRAILDGYKTTYVSYLGSEPTYSYTVNYMVDGNATPVKTEKVDNVAMNTAINYTPVAPEGYLLKDTEQIEEHIYVSDLVINVSVVAKEKATILGTLNNNELYYFDKDTTDENYNVVLPNELGEEFVSAKIGATAISATYDKDSKTLTVPVSEIANITCGDAKLTIETATKLYTASITVADHVLTTPEDVTTIITNVDNKTDYIILGNDIENVTGYSHTLADTNAFAGTIDGKGYAIKGMTMSSDSHAFLSMLGGNGVLKNIALINVTHGFKNGGTALLLNQNRGTVENVFVSGTTNGAGALINANYASGTVKNVIANITGSASTTSTSGVIKTNYVVDDKVANNYVITNFGDITNGIKAYSLAYELFDDFNGTLPAALKNSFWSLDESQNLYFGDELVIEGVRGVVGEKNDGELFYFGKDVTSATGYAGAYVEDGYYKVTMPESFTANEITTLSIAGKAITDFNYDSGVLKIATSELSAIANGVVDMNLLADGIKYQAKVTVADLVIKTESDFNLISSSNTLNNTDKSGYVVLDGDIIWQGDAYLRNTGHLYGTIDGKGYAIKNLIIGSASTGAGLFYTSQGGTVKDIAFINVGFDSNITYGGVIATVAAGSNISNVFISIAAGNENKGIGGIMGQFTSMRHTISNVIVSYPGKAENTSGAYSYDYGTSDSLSLAMTDVYAITAGKLISKEGTNTKVDYNAINASALADLAALKTASENLKGFNDLWSIDENGNLCFGDEIVISAE